MGVENAGVMVFSDGREQLEKGRASRQQLGQHHPPMEAWRFT